MKQDASLIASAPTAAGAASDTQFIIPVASSLQETRPRTLKHDDTFAVFDHTGDVVSFAGNPQGVYHKDTRYLSQLHLLLCDAPPILLSSTLREDNATLTCDLTNPDIHTNGHIGLAHDVIHIRRSKFLWNGACYERLGLRNFDERRHKLRLTLEFAADFADLFEVRGTRRQRRGVLQPAEIRDSTVTLGYIGLDRKRRRTRLRFHPAPATLEADRAVFDIELGPQERAELFVEIQCEPGPPRRNTWETFFLSLRDARRALRTASARATAVETSNAIFNEAVRRSVSDLYMLVTDLPEGAFPYAGIPWFSTVFGRDALITALQTLWCDPSIARGVLSYLAAHQAQHENPEADAEPGKILHEVRHGEMAELGEVPFRRYYGSVDSTPLFVMLAGAYLDRTGDLAFARSLWPQIEAALDWMDNYGDRDGDGFIEYGRQAHEGLINQGWKDSHDSIFHSDGTLAKGPIAVVEVQAYAYAAKRAAAKMAHALGHEPRAVGLEREAETLRAHFDQAFWDEALGMYVLALDGDKRPCRVRASNAGHALFTGIALPKRTDALVSALMSVAQFSGWGIRTLATSEPRYNPMSYHNGSVWPHDNALIAMGFARYGYTRQAARLFEGLFDASFFMDLRRLPELFCGFTRQRNQGPTFYPVACSPQAWAATVPLSLLQTCLGLSFEPDKHCAAFYRPKLPAFLNDVILRGLAIGPARVDVVLRRAGTEVALHVLARHGDISVTTTN